MDNASQARPKGPLTPVAGSRVAGKIVSSVILLIGAAALVGWLVMELYVKVVTAD
ncbi:hypothetical protein [Variovorax sp. SRS16]|uniref:hypothetical protein n=1 Tax=Variovorax sp. SRS16 TaxID=282217 RepID=UPI0013A5973F|nr:hypothetical protein [Variovorax sp. SRS16]